jgi:hypothetical protein
LFEVANVLLLEANPHRMRGRTRRIAPPFGVRVILSGTAIRGVAEPRIPFNPVVARGPWPPSFASAAGAYRRGEMPRRLGAGTLPRLAIAGDAEGAAGSRGPASIATSTPARSGSPPRSSSRASSQVLLPGARGVPAQAARDRALRDLTGNRRTQSSRGSPGRRPRRRLPGASRLLGCIPASLSSPPSGPLRTR